MIFPVLTSITRPVPDGPPATNRRPRLSILRPTEGKFGPRPSLISRRSPVRRLTAIMSPSASEPRYAVARLPIVMPSGWKPFGSPIRSGNGRAWAVPIIGPVNGAPSATPSNATASRRGMDRIIADITPEVLLGMSRYTISRPYAAIEGRRASKDLLALVITPAKMRVLSDWARTAHHEGAE